MKILAVYLKNCRITSFLGSTFESIASYQQAGWICWSLAIGRASEWKPKAGSYYGINRICILIFQRPNMSTFKKECQNQNAKTCAGKSQVTAVAFGAPPLFQWSRNCIPSQMQVPKTYFKLEIFYINTMPKLKLMPWFLIWVLDQSPELHTYQQKITTFVLGHKKILSCWKT